MLQRGFGVDIGQIFRGDMVIRTTWPFLYIGGLELWVS